MCFVESCTILFYFHFGYFGNEVLKVNLSFLLFILESLTWREEISDTCHTLIGEEIYCLIFKFSLMGEKEDLFFFFYFLGSLRFWELKLLEEESWKVLF